MGIRIQPSNHSQLSDTFRRYAEWNNRDGADLFVDQTRKYANELYEQTAAIAPTESEIRADVEAQGWKIPARFPDGRRGRGTPSQWLGAAYQAAVKAGSIVKKRGRGAKKFNDAQKQAFKEQRPTLQQMQAFVIARRLKSIMYLASGWLGSIAALGGSVKASSGKVDPKRGGAEIRRSPTGVEVGLWNETAGIETMEAKTKFVEAAALIRAADMWVYIRRKMDEAQNMFFRRAA